MTPGEQSRELYSGMIRRRKVDRYGEEVHGESEPALPRTARIDRLRAASPVELTAAELAYLQQYDLMDAHSGEIDEMERAMRDWRAAQ